MQPPVFICSVTFSKRSALQYLRRSRHLLISKSFIMFKVRCLVKRGLLFCACMSAMQRTELSVNKQEALSERVVNMSLKYPEPFNNITFTLRVYDLETVSTFVRVTLQGTFRETLNNR